jgi:serine phosphatase RsbU (regulator of sigma subunit)
MSPLWTEITGFARWFEDSAAPDQLETVCLRLETDGSATLFAPSRRPLGGWERLWRLLRSLGIREVELDPRLESNQIADVLTLLFAERRALRGNRPRRVTHPAKRLLSADGIDVACTVTRLDAGRLTVSYSYCMTRFSRLVKWFKERQTHLRDHRALFRAAPRYAVLVGMIPLAVFLLYAAFHESFYLLMAASLLGSTAMFGATYLFFMTVGSVEYDNEEQAHILKQAYDQLKQYADRIRSDMDRARTVQERLLPELDAMPLPDRLEWAASFVPQEEVGGDYFDASLTTQGHVAVVFADVSGHGLSAALITAIIKTTFEGWLEGEDGLVPFIRGLNQRLFDLTPLQSFAAVAVGIYDPDRRTFSYCNCGHSPYPYLIPGTDGPPRPLDAAQVIILGVVPDIDPRPATVDLERGDTLIFVTDGITEAQNDLEEEYETERLERYLTDHREEPLQRLVTGLVETVERFTGGSDRGDDQTILAVSVR